MTNIVIKAAGSVGNIIYHEPTLDGLGAFTGANVTGGKLVITAGTWSGDTIGFANGGTGLTALGTAGQVLTVNSGATGTQWSTPSVGNPAQIVTAGTSPTIAVGAGAGTGGSATLNANATNLAGTVSITTGTIPLASSTLATITFNGAGYPNGSIVVVSPANALTAALSGASTAILIGGTTTMVLTSGTVALGVGTYAWNYVVIGF